MFNSTLPALGLLCVAATAAQAAPAKLLGEFAQWRAAAVDETDGKRCFMLSTPSAEAPTTLRHGDVYFFVKTADGAGKTESSFQTGYDFARDSVVRVTIGEESFQMLTQGSNAWLRRLEREPELLAAMRAGSQMVLEARSARGNETSYTFSLAGVTAASRLLDRCD